MLIGKMSFVGPRPDVPGYADQLQGDDRKLLRLRLVITGPATLKYRQEDEIISAYVAGHYSFLKSLEMIFAAVLGRKVEFGGEEI